MISTSIDFVEDLEKKKKKKITLGLVCAASCAVRDWSVDSAVNG
jgi:hypothetical protein